MTNSNTVVTCIWCNDRRKRSYSWPVYGGHRNENVVGYVCYDPIRRTCYDEWNEERLPL